MNLGMNRGTKIRTVLRIAASLQRAAAMATAAVTAITDQYHLTSVALAWLVFTVVCDFVVDFVSTYYNNDYTPEAEAGTLTTREMKASKDCTVQVNEEPEDSEVI